MNVVEKPSVVKPPRPLAEVPCASGDFLLGNLRHLFGDVRAFLTEAYLRHGPVFRVRVLHRRFTVLAGLEANDFVVREGKDLLSSKPTWQPQADFFGATRSLLTMDGPEHAQLRRAQAPGYSRSVIKSCLPEVVGLIREQIGRWPTGRALPAVETLQKLLAGQLGVHVAGFSPQGYLDDLLFFVRRVLATTVTRQEPRILLHTPRFRYARRRIWEMAEEVKAANEPAGSGWPVSNLIRDVLHLRQTRPDLLPESDLRLTVLGPFIAGLDTAASTCAFLLYALLKDPALLAAAKAESDELLAEPDLTPERLERFDVIRRALQETLRMYPIAPALQRTTKVSFTFAGYKVPAGETIIVATTVPHYLPQYFPDPTRFDIDRHTPEKLRQLPARCL
ncbi:MAG: cytochrome P450, partial [Candidatus Eremiobacteraeota bacterium]|nr:cytochrome P450 [Candidatus Eremiobacteraeota bacterium]